MIYELYVWGRWRVATWTGSSFVVIDGKRGFLCGPLVWSRFLEEGRARITRGAA